MYVLCRLFKVEKNYDISDNDGFVVIFGIKYYCFYFYSFKFIVEIDYVLFFVFIIFYDFIGWLV